VVSLEQGYWSGGGGSVVPLRQRRREAADQGPRKHGDVPWSMCHSDMCLIACNMTVHRLTRPHW
jgi:hypothetical protein